MGYRFRNCSWLDALYDIYNGNNNNRKNMKTGLYKLVRRLKIMNDGSFLIKEKPYRTFMRYQTEILLLNARVIARRKGLKFRYTREEVGLKAKRKMAWYKATSSGQ